MASKKLDLPPKNDLIPKVFTRLPVHAAFSAKVQLLKQWPGTYLWYKKDDRSPLPKAMASMKMYTTDINYGNGMDSKIFIEVWKKI